jgi:hypothetical protein
VVGEGGMIEGVGFTSRGILNLLYTVVAIKVVHAKHGKWCERGGCKVDIRRGRIGSKIEREGNVKGRQMPNCLKVSIVATVPGEGERGGLGAIAIVVILDQESSFLVRNDGQEAIIGAHTDVWTYGAIFAESARLARLGWVTAKEIRATNGLIG